MAMSIPILMGPGLDAVVLLFVGNVLWILPGRRSKKIVDISFARII
jgi:hypothetical protein